MKNKRTILIIVLLLPVQMILVRLVAQNPEYVERYYSMGLYPILSKVARYVFGVLPFSFGDIMYVVLIFLTGRALFLFIKSKFRNWKISLLRIGAIASVVYAIFHILWGLNYYRLPLNETLGLDRDYTTSELLEVTQKLVAKSNLLHSKLAANDTLPVEMKVQNKKGEYEDFTKAQVFKNTLEGYQKIKVQFPSLHYPPKSIKSSLLSYPLSIMGYSGYLNPITNEAHINALIPAHRIPVVSCHEQAHQLGFAKENEANFIAVMATLANDDIYFQYSGSIFALRYCLSDLYRRDRDRADALKAEMNLGILKNYEQSRDFWDAMENPIEPLIEKIYSSYLKANNQPQGTASYSYVVALLVNYNKAHPEVL